MFEYPLFKSWLWQYDICFHNHKLKKRIARKKKIYSLILGYLWFQHSSSELELSIHVSFTWCCSLIFYGQNNSFGICSKWKYLGSPTFQLQLFRRIVRKGIWNFSNEKTQQQNTKFEVNKFIVTDTIEPLMKYNFDFSVLSMPFWTCPINMSHTWWNFFSVKLTLHLLETF